MASPSKHLKCDNNYWYIKQLELWMIIHEFDDSTRVIDIGHSHTYHALIAIRSHHACLIREGGTIRN